MDAIDLPWVKPFLQRRCRSVRDGGDEFYRCDLKRNHEGFPHAADRGAETWLWTDEIVGLALFGGKIWIGCDR